MERTLDTLLDAGWDITFVPHVDDSTGEPVLIIECFVTHPQSGHWFSATAPTVIGAFAGVAEMVRDRTPA